MIRDGSYGAGDRKEQGATNMNCITLLHGIVSTQFSRGRFAMAAAPDSGTKDKNYDLVAVTHLCLEHVWRLEQYAQDAEREGDEELVTLFRRMQEHSRRGGEECKRLLGQRLNEEA